jgi:hypothetical protein
VRCWAKDGCRIAIGSGIENTAGQQAGRAVKERIVDAEISAREVL